MQKSFLLILLFTSFLIGCATMNPESSWEQKYQGNADKIRINDVHTILGIVYKYHEKTGRYPLADGSHPLPVYVAITDKKAYVKPEFVDKDIFIHEIKSVLGEDVQIPMDPQKYDVYGARFYLYSTDGNDFQISARLFKPTEGTQAVDKYTHVYLLSGHEDIFKANNSNEADHSFINFENATSCEDYGNWDLEKIKDIKIIPLPFFIIHHEDGQMTRQHYPATEKSIDEYIHNAIGSNYNIFIPKEDQPLIEIFKYIDVVASNTGKQTDSPLNWGYAIPAGIINANTYIYFPIGIERESNRHINARFYVLISNSVGNVIYSRCMPYNPTTLSVDIEAFKQDIKDKLPLTN